MKFDVKANSNIFADLNLEYLTREKLSIILNHTISGSDTVLLTALGKSRDPKLILDDLDKLISTNSKKLNKHLLDLENLNRSKYGPRSIAKPWIERRGSVYSYFEEGINKDVVKMRNTKPQFSKDLHKLRPISLNQAVPLLKNSTSSGLPFMSRKGDVKDIVRADFHELLKRQDPCALFTRTQEDGKTRDIWGFPIADTLNEMMYYKPLLDFQKRAVWRSALNGPEMVDLRITDLINRALVTSLSLLSIDFTKFDASVKSKLQGYAFDYISSLFQTGFNDSIAYIADRFNSIGLLTPDGLIKGRHGVPSGSTFTNEVDSIVQYLVARDSKNIFSENMQIQGDDGSYAVLNSKVDVLFGDFERYGLSVNRDKSYISDSYVVFLQKLYDIEYRQSDGIIRGIYPLYRALCRLVYQERWINFEEFGIDGKDYYSIRAISILENCKHHPLFKEFVSLILDLDKYNLEVTQNGIERYVMMNSNSSGAEGILINQYGDDIRSIRSFETFKLIKELRH